MGDAACDAVEVQAGEVADVVGMSALAGAGSVQPEGDTPTRAEAAHIAAPQAPSAGRLDAGVPDPTDPAHD